MKVCDGRYDCLARTDENPEFCGGCKVGQYMCNGSPVCRDQGRRNSVDMVTRTLSGSGKIKQNIWMLCT